MTSIPGKVKLIPRDNVVHLVDVCRQEGTLCLVDGWLAFLDKYGIEVKDDILFSYSKNNALFVDFYDRSGMIKLLPGYEMHRDRCRKNLAEKRRLVLLARAPHPNTDANTNETPVDQMIPPSPHSPVQCSQLIVTTRRSVTSKRKPGHRIILVMHTCCLLLNSSHTKSICTHSANLSIHIQHNV